MQRLFAETFPRIKLSALCLSDVRELGQAGYTTSLSVGALLAALSGASKGAQCVGSNLCLICGVPPTCLGTTPSRAVDVPVQ
jgi:hypothetical protein